MKITRLGLQKYVGKSIMMRIPSDPPQIYEGKLKIKKSGEFFVGNNALKTGYRVGIDTPGAYGQEYSRFYDVKLD